MTPAVPRTKCRMVEEHPVSRTQSSSQPKCLAKMLEAIIMISLVKFRRRRSPLNASPTSLKSYGIRTI